ncbi:unnamed protein product [Gadus morhua 'NCC']
MPIEGEELIGEWKSIIKRMRACQENISTIKEGMEKTYNNRRLWITASSPTVEEIFAEYPRFVDMPYLRVNLQACHQFLRMTRLAIKRFKSSSGCCLQLHQGEGKATANAV